jgi:outer membrane lipoprotein-sorting protein
MGNMIRLFRTNFNKAVAANEGSFSFEGEKKFSGRSALVFKARFPQSKGYYGKTIELYVDKALNLPVKLTVWNWDDKLIEFYQLTNLKINPGLTSKDFDDSNPGYNF